MASDHATVAVVPVKSTWASKINWTQTIGLLASVLALAGFTMTPEQQVHVVAAIQVATAIATWTIRTFFTESVTYSSATNVSEIPKADVANAVAVVPDK